MSNGRQPQSWTSYFLSVYSSSVTPSHDPDLYAPSATRVSPSTKHSSEPRSRTTIITTTTESLSPTSTPTSPSATNSSYSSPWGPYTKIGRGGAGNFAWESTASPPTTTASVAPSISVATVSDEEAGQKPQTCSSIAQRQKAAAEMEECERLDILAARAHEMDREGYKHTGRGGAGNWTAADGATANDAGATSRTSNGDKDTDTAKSTPEVRITPTHTDEAIIFSSNLSNKLLPRTNTGNTTTTAATTKPKQPRGYYGRGGAGNHASAIEAMIQANKAAEAETEERKRRRRIGDDEEADLGGSGGGLGQGFGGWRKKVVENVELTVRQPEGAVIRERRGDGRAL